MRNHPKGVSSLDGMLLTALLLMGGLGLAGGVTSGAVSISLGRAGDVEAEYAQSIMQRIRAAATFEDLLSYADAPPPEATSPRPPYVELTRQTWYAALQGERPGRLGLGKGQIRIRQQGSAPNRLAIIEVRIEPLRPSGSAPLSLVSFRAE